MSEKAIIILSTFPNERAVATVAKKLIDRKLCGCVNFTRIRSIYAWKGKLKEQQEFLALFKSTMRSSRKLKTAIASMHPYEVPEIMELKISDVSNSYLSWLAAGSTNAVAKKRHDAAKRGDT
jgi:periplasmic divalent cation tolerance protein